jgi:hypothetical protein
MKPEKEILRLRSTPIVSVLSELSDIKGILCFGSYAMDTFDQYSDIDFYAFCHPEIVPSPARRDALQRIKGIRDLQMDHAEFGRDEQWCPQGDRFRLNGIQFDITYNTVDWTRTVVRKVKDNGAISIPELKFRPYTMLGLLENSTILYDPEVVLEGIKSALYPYPSKLRQSLLSQNLPIVKSSLEDLKDYVRRNIGNTAFHFHLERIIDSLGTILFALNERYDPATKRVEEVYCELRIVPENFLQRYNMILQTSLTAGGKKAIVQELETLTDDIEKLIRREAGKTGG